MINKLDKIANTLEGKGLAHLAASIDSVSNSIEKQAFLSGLLQSLKNSLGHKVLPPEKALEILREHNIHHIDQHLIDEAMGEEKTAGIMDAVKGILGNPVKIALISLALAAGSANAADINKMVQLMPMPSSTQLTLLDQGVAPLWAFKSSFKNMVENNLESDTPLGKYVQERVRAGENPESLVKDLMTAFQKKLTDPSNKNIKDRLDAYLHKKEVGNPLSFLEPLVQEVAKDSLLA